MTRNDLLAILVRASAYMRHDPACPAIKPNPAACTCGEALLAADVGTAVRALSVMADPGDALAAESQAHAVAEARLVQSNMGLATALNDKVNLTSANVAYVDQIRSMKQVADDIAVILANSATAAPQRLTNIGAKLNVPVNL